MTISLFSFSSKTVSYKPIDTTVLLAQEQEPQTIQQPIELHQEQEHKDFTETKLEPATSISEAKTAEEPKEQTEGAKGKTLDIPHHPRRREMPFFSNDGKLQRKFPPWT
jgi:hypothetical protein